MELINFDRALRMQVYKVYDIVGESSSSIIKYSENDMMQRDQ